MGRGNVSTGEVFWSDETYRIYGFEPGSVKPSYAVFFGIVHPDDRLALEKALEQVAREGSDTSWIFASFALEERFGISTA